jgi:hypothetical protein
MILIYDESYISYYFRFVILFNFMTFLIFKYRFTVYLILAVTIIHFLFFIIECFHNLYFTSFYIHFINGCLYCSVKPYTLMHLKP